MLDSYLIDIEQCIVSQLISFNSLCVRVGEKSISKLRYYRFVMSVSHESQTPFFDTERKADKMSGDTMGPVN